MTTRAQLRKTALTFPEVAEENVDKTLKFSVRGKEFTSLSSDGIVRIRLPRADAEEAVAAYPAAEPLLHAGRPIGFQAPLPDVGGQHLWHLVMTAWKHRAPASLAAKLSAIVESSAVPGSDLPTSIGRPATRALAVAGITTLEHVTSHTEAELLDLHGVGPKAVRILADTLAERGKSLR